MKIQKKKKKKFTKKINLLSENNFSNKKKKLLIFEKNFKNEKNLEKKKIEKNYLFFFLEISNFLFLTKNEKIQEALLKNNIMKYLLKIFEKKNNFENFENSKIFKIYFCTYLKNLLQNSKNFKKIFFDFEKSFEIFWKILKENFSLKKINIILSLNLSILKIINFSEKIEFLKKITFLAEKEKKKLKLEILEEIIKKTRKMIFIEIDSNLTSESENFQKSEKSLKKIFNFEIEKIEKNYKKIFEKKNYEKIFEKKIKKIDLVFEKKKKVINLVRSIFEDDYCNDDFVVLKKRGLKRGLASSG